MKRCVIHFGLAKTGSTSIQKTFSKIGTRAGVSYVQCGEANAAKALALAFMAKPAEYRPLKRLGAAPDALQAERVETLATLERYFSSGAKTLLLSSEMLSGFDEKTLQAMRDWLVQRADSVQLIGYVRPIRSYLESMLSQSFKNGNGKFNVAQRYPGFRERLRKLELIFGRENVSYRLFDTASLHAGCVVQDLAQFVGVDIEASEVRRVNDGLSKEATGLLYAYRKLGPGYGVGPKAVKENISLVHRLSGLPGPKLRLADTLIDPVLKANATDLSWMERRLRHSLSANGTAPADAGIVTVEADLLRFSDGALSWLAEAADLKSNQREKLLGGGAQDIADAVDLLRAVPLAPDREKRRARRNKQS